MIHAAHIHGEGVEVHSPVDPLEIVRSINAPRYIEYQISLLNLNHGIDVLVIVAVK